MSIERGRNSLEGIPRDTSFPPGVDVRAHVIRQVGENHFEASAGDVTMDNSVKIHFRHGFRYEGKNGEFVHCDNGQPQAYEYEGQVFQIPGIPGTARL